MFVEFDMKTHKNKPRKSQPSRKTERMRRAHNFNYVQLFKSMFGAHFDSDSFWVQLYQFDVMLIRQVCTLRKAHHANECRFFFCVGDDNNDDDDVDGCHFGSFTFRPTKELQRIIILAKQRQTQSTVVWKIKSRIPHNESFCCVRIALFFSASFCVAFVARTTTKS